MHQVRLVLQEVVDAFDDAPPPEHELVPHRHELVLHVGPQSMHEVYPLVEKAVEQPLLDVPPVGEHLPVEFLGKHRPHALVAVVHVCRCQAERYDFPTVVAQEVQLEPVAPSHRAFPVLGEPLEHLVHVAAHVVADGYHGAVHEAHAAAPAKGFQPHEQHHAQEHARHELDEAVVGHGIGEITGHVLADVELVVMLEIGERAEVEAHDHGHDFALAQFPPPVAVALAIVSYAEVFGAFGIKILAKLIYDTENLYNFVVGNHRLELCNRLIITY